MLNFCEFFLFKFITRYQFLGPTLKIVPQCFSIHSCLSSLYQFLPCPLLMLTVFSGPHSVP